MNICWPTTFYGNPYTSCQDILLKPTNVSLLVATFEKSGDHQSKWTSFTGDNVGLYKILWQFIQQLFRYFSLDQSEGSSDSQPIDP